LEADDAAGGVDRAVAAMEAGPTPAALVIRPGVLA
jgi:hypothetical protein